VSAAFGGVMVPFLGGRRRPRQRRRGPAGYL